MIISVLSIMGTQLRRLVRYHMGLYVGLSVYRLLRPAESALSKMSGIFLAFISPVTCLCCFLLPCTCTYIAEYF